MSFQENFELSGQRVEPLPEAQSPELAFHTPLLDLAAEAPALYSLGYRSERVLFPFSNDECTAPYFDQLQVRTLTPEYQQARNRVAVVIGESGLAANLPFIPEDTIVVVDKSPDMCIFMQEYIAGLRTAKDRHEWGSRLHAVGPRDVPDFVGSQLQDWQEASYPHPLVDDVAFAAARAQASEKVIVPWRADITNQKDVSNLAHALRSREATITLMNLTNVLPLEGALQTPAEWAAQLRALPLSPRAPILTTSLGYQRVQNPLEVVLSGKIEKANAQTGPFFGLENLGEASGQNVSRPLGAIAARQFAGGEQTFDSYSDRESEELRDLLATILDDVFPPESPEF